MRKVTKPTVTQKLAAVVRNHVPQTPQPQGKTCRVCGKSMSKFASTHCSQKCRDAEQGARADAEQMAVHDALEKVKMTAVTRRGLGMVRSFLIEAADADKTPLYTKLPKLSPKLSREFNQAMAWLEQNEISYAE